jgi:predicted MPP superfamily phosphohydrolase
MPASVVVGDLHGKVEIAEYWIKNREHRSIIFIGDYLDSFDRSIEDQYELLEMVLDAVENQENVYALMGNHELSYLLPERYQASGYKHTLAAKIEHLHQKMWKNLKLWLVNNEFLISHAGFRPEFIDNVGYRLTKEEKLITIDEKLKTIPL